MAVLILWSLRSIYCDGDGGPCCVCVFVSEYVSCVCVCVCARVCGCVGVGVCVYVSPHHSSHVSGLLAVIILPQLFSSEH